MTGATAPPAPFTGRGGRADAAFRYATIAAGLVVLVVLGAIAVTTVRRALPAFDLMGFRFLTSSRWDPNADQFGAKAFLYGSLVASAIAATVAASSPPEAMTTSSTSMTAISSAPCALDGMTNQ